MLIIDIIRLLLFHAHFMAIFIQFIHILNLPCTLDTLFVAIVIAFQLNPKQKCSTTSTQSNINIHTNKSYEIVSYPYI